ncbi:dna replication regulator sld2 [Ophiostoma piceae UAMH 11346]|uniref:DNA replication regulator SLD2 n=1 Tax=Ophiostoma piceae (strain UAMH 11346) TaxID=1262450 RepID=S3BVB5_OPHP1|nr:dna replication regulator sld2 [Ophiostoma piceae UAMH 11346]
MLEIDRVAYEAEAQYIRQALKTWETAWAREHGGAKPGRDDIKANEIAKQYTAYNRIRGILSGKAAPEQRQASKPASKPKRKSDADAAQTHTTPSKRRAVAHETPSRHAATDTPSKSGSHVAAETPSISRKLFSPVVPTSIGPTPQRDGRVLGLFDVLNEEEETQKRRQSIDATPSKRGAGKMDATPRKQTIDLANLPFYPSDSDDENENAINVRRLGRTPMSSGRRNLLNHFTAPPRPPAFEARGALGTTPLKSRSANSQAAQTTNLLATPSKDRSAPMEFATPAFLRRQTITLPSVDENGANDENGYYDSPPSKLRLPRKPLVRGLSSVLASLRKAEDDRLDEELDIMREMETETDEAAEGAGTVDDSQRELQQLEALEALEDGSKGEGGQRLLGGFDDEGLYDSEPEEAHDRGQPLRLYKKKGQKRTTRLVNMRPTRTKRVEANNGGDDSSDVVPETQARTSVDGDAGENGGDGENDGSDYEDGTTKTKPSKSKAKTKTKPAQAHPEGAVKKAVRKVNELAHANFKRLKIKNTGTKGGPRFNSRFRRRR